MAELVDTLTPSEQRELVRLMKKLGKHAMNTYPGKRRARRVVDQEPAVTE